MPPKSIEVILNALDNYTLNDDEAIEQATSDFLNLVGYAKRIFDN